MVSHDSTAVEENHYHQQNREDDHTEAGAEQRNLDTCNGQRIIKETQQLPAGGYQKGAQDAAGHTADAPAGYHR